MHISFSLITTPAQFVVKSQTPISSMAPAEESVPSTLMLGLPPALYHFVISISLSHFTIPPSLPSPSLILSRYVSILSYIYLELRG
jgi:hypothetical protein